MFGLKTIEWFGLEAVAQRVNSASAKTGAWLKLVYQLPRTDAAHPRQWTKSAHLLRIIRPDFYEAKGEVNLLTERQVQEALTRLLDLHVAYLQLPTVVVAEHDIWEPEDKHWVVLFQSRIFSHALTTFSVLSKCAEGLCSPKRTPHLSALRSPRRVTLGGVHTSSWDVGLWLGAGYADLVSRATSSPANHIPLKELL
jgi:hypothetical protein